MDAGGVRQALVIPGHGYSRDPAGIEDTREENDRIAANRDALPGTLPRRQPGIVEPRDGEASLAELERCADRSSGWRP